MAKILVVDDAAFMRSMLRLILTEAGHEVEEAANGQEACTKYLSTKPDLVTLDITMPVMDGIETVKRLKEIDSSARIIMCSAMGQQGMVAQAVKNGAIDFIVKPFQRDRVLNAVMNALNRQ
ncbi:response regulator [Paenibacillus chartarius]|uniref:Response regulator n=1 Tax=Paenibacillus chartarius TaxID=747481 RepID=A0ABV6DN92_9BACL